MLLKECAKCGALIPYGRSRCQACEAQRGQEQQENLTRSRRRDSRRRSKADPKYRAFYRSKDWRRLSLAVISQADYRCSGCGGIATEVHHIQPIQTEAGWERRLDRSNCEPVCIRCHNKRHKRF